MKQSVSCIQERRMCNVLIRRGYVLSSLFELEHSPCQSQLPCKSWRNPSLRAYGLSKTTRSESSFLSTKLNSGGLEVRIKWNQLMTCGNITATSCVCAAVAYKRNWALCRPLSQKSSGGLEVLLKKASVRLWSTSTVFQSVMEIRSSAH